MPIGLVKRADGIYIDVGMSKPALTAAVAHVFQSDWYFAGLDYAALINALYGVGPDMGQLQALRLADALQPFDPARLSLYKPPKLSLSYAEYYFQQLYLEEETLADGSVLPERPVQLDIDEFIAFMWQQGIRFGIDVAAVRAAMASPKADRITFATDLEPAPGQHASVVEVSADLHRSDAPKARADGRIDLQSFQNRFPQIKAQVRLLKKLEAVPGLPGFDLAGRKTEPEAPKDLTLRFLAGEGTEARMAEDGEYLVSTREGFLSVDSKSNRISITDKIISLEGVSGRTTGNLQLAGAYEEYGDVQEQRDVTGSDITVHGNVYGNIHSRGGTVVLDKNLVSGSVHNAAGDIRIAGVASNSVIYASNGAVVVQRAENCVISATRVKIEEASNCEIIGEEVLVSVAEGCVIAGRNVEVESAGPRRRTEMVIYVLVKDVTQFDREIADLELRVATFAQANQDSQLEMERIAALPDVRRYLALAAKLRTQELVLTPEQGQHLRKIASAVAEEMKAIQKLKLDVQVGQTQHKLLSDRLERVIEQKVAAAGIARCGLHMANGETMVRTMPFAADTAALRQLQAKDLKQRLRGTPSGGELLFADSSGTLDWHLNPRLRVTFP
ncbi:flagellar assembly protein A [Duganella sp. sic0402]|uniref:flagellar assembly protein A n=1 Tax=Duganella sp. sic0402 TaxID=2854786 RepID=UPI001E645CD0|nr:flagellar assembly protein A [Duganella sp. sic0402]